MKNLSNKLISFLLLLTLAFSLFTFIGCGEEKITEVDYVSQLTLDMFSETKKQKVTVKTYIDGDTTHFRVPTDVISTGVLKARYLAINTPESTGKIEEYGQAASDFTHEKLANAKEIYVESNDSNWNFDSTGERHLVFVWYNTESDPTFRNLNLEILQNGLAIASSINATRYADICNKALEQAKALKLKLFSGIPDPDYFYGKAIDVKLKDLRANIEYFNGKKVAFEANVARSIGSTLYVVDYDEESALCYGVQVYKGFNNLGAIEKKLEPGFRIRFVGTVQYWEAGGTYQISGLEYDNRPAPGTEKDYISLVSEVEKPAFVEITPEKYNSTVTLEIDDEDIVFDYAALALNTPVKFTGLYVKKVYTTKTEGSDSKGAMTLYCEKNGKEVIVRTGVWSNGGKVVTEDQLKGKTIDIQGIIDYYKAENSETGTYQIAADLFTDLLNPEILEDA